MIFNTITNNLNGAINKIGVFNRNFADLKNAISANGIKGLFNSISPAITSNDLSLIKEYNRLVGIEGISSQTAWYRTMLSSSNSAQSLFNDENNLIRTNNGLILSEKALTQATNTMSLSAKAGKVALNALAVAGNMITFTLIAESISFAAKKFNEYIHTAEITREKSIELTNSWASENDFINNSISTYEELKEKLNDTSLSASEVKIVKKDLLDVQKGLIDNYGQEALGIDLVNGKYDEQIIKLKNLSKQKAQNYVAENYSNIQEDQKYINEKINLNTSLGFGGTQAKPDDYSGSGFDLGKYLKKYDKLDAKVTEPNGQYGLAGTVNLITNGTREEVYDQLNQLFNDLSKDFGESNKDVNKFKETLSGIIQDSFDAEQIRKSKSNIKKYAEAEILSRNDTRKLFDDATIAVDKYNDALSSGNGIEDARKNLNDIKSKVKKLLLIYPVPNMYLTTSLVKLIRLLKSHTNCPINLILITP